MLAALAAVGVLAIFTGIRTPRPAYADPTDAFGGSFISGQLALVYVGGIFNEDDDASDGAVNSLAVRIEVYPGGPGGAVQNLTFADCTVDNAANGFADDVVGNCTVADTADQNSALHLFEWGNAQVQSVDGDGTNDTWRLRLVLNAICTSQTDFFIAVFQDGAVTTDFLTCFTSASPTPGSPTVTVTPFTPTATPSPTPGPPAIVELAAPETTVNCGSSIAITARVRDIAGTLVGDGVPVVLSATFGVVDPASTTTLAGIVNAVYRAPVSQAGTARVAVTAGTGSASIDITVTCAAAAPTSAPTSAPPAPAVPQIRPPATGEAGLAGTGLAWHGYAGLALVLGALAGMLAVARRRA